jgi:succinoglycan biosynthesis transport protein ExoP
VHIRDVISAMRRRWLLVAAVFAACVATSAVVVFREPAQYRATATIQLTDARRSITQGLEARDAERTNPRDITASQVQVLKSRALIGVVVDSEGLRLRAVSDEISPALFTRVQIDSAVDADTFVVRFSDNAVTVRKRAESTEVPYGAPYEGVGLSFAIASRPPVPQTTLIVSPREAAIDRALGNVRTAPRGETNVIDVSYTDIAPEVAQRVTNRLVRAFHDANIRSAQSQSRRRRVFLEEQLHEIEGQLAKAENALASFRSSQRVFSARGSLEARQGSLLALEMRRGELAADRRVYGDLLAKLQRPRSPQGEDAIRALIAVPDLSANPVVKQLYEQRVQYQMARDSLTTGVWRSAPTNPDVARLDQLIATTDQRFVGALGGQIATLDARLEALDTLRAQNAAVAAALPRVESIEEQLARRVEANRGLVDRLKDEFQKARMAEVVEEGQVEILDEASLPYRPLSRMRSLKLLLGVIVGLGLGVVAALVTESASTRVRRRGDIEDELQVPVLSVIPKIEAPRSRRIPSLRMRAGSSGANGAGAVGDGAAPNGKSSNTIPMTPAGSEAFRLLRSSLKWRQADRMAQSIAVTSALPQEGKTTTSTNLAAAFALEGQRVLLIDCDVRRTRLHRAFRVPRNPGLVQVLRGLLPPASAVRSTFITGLSFLPAGRDVDTFGDLLGSDRMRMLLKELSENFDIIVLDTPPVLSVSDATAVAPLVDGVVVVVHAGVTDRRAVRQTLDQLERVGAQLIGAVLNDSRGAIQRYEEYYYSEDYSQVAE